MSAFRAYAGGYEVEGRLYNWRCYATARVHEVRKLEHAPFPRPPGGLKWVMPAQQDHRQRVGCLVDEAVEDFSQILLQVQALAEPKPTRPHAEAASAPA